MDKLSKKLTEILGIEGFKENDIVKWNAKHAVGGYQFLCYMDNKTALIIGQDGWEEVFIKDLVTTKRDFTLSEVLMAINSKCDNWRLKCSWIINTVIIIVGEKGNHICFDLTKTLFQQEQSTITTIQEIIQ